MRSRPARGRAAMTIERTGEPSGSPVRVWEAGRLYFGAFVQRARQSSRRAALSSPVRAAS